MVLNVVLGCALQPEQHEGQKIFRAPFYLSSGDLVYAPITAAGPMPISLGGYQVFPVEFELTRSSSHTSSTNALLQWHFRLTTDGAESSLQTDLPNLSRVTVEEVFRHKRPQPLIDDLEPTFSGLSWRAQAEKIAMPLGAGSWLRSGDASIHVFRFTLLGLDGQKTVIHQPTWFSVQYKQTLLANLNAGNE